MNKKLLKEIEETPLSDSDIKKILPGINIVSYPQLKGLKTLPFDKKGRLIIFFETESAIIGHWLAIRITNKPKLIQYFDSYGIKPDGDKKWISKEKQEELGEDGDFLVNILKNYYFKGYKIMYNSYDFQSKNPSISTCGRYACLFLLMDKPLIDFNEFLKLGKRTKLNNDELVSFLINRYTKL